MSAIDDALGILLSDELSHVVDMVLAPSDGLVEAHARGGSVGFTRDGSVWERGRNPLAHQEPGAFSPLESELGSIRPANEENHYPFAYDNIAQLFEDTRAPDLAVVHTPAHNWEERGGHRGEHGSPDVVQSRAPLIVAGRGVRRMGPLAASARMVDVAPTLAALAGAGPLSRSDGRVLTEVLAPKDPPAHVVAFLCDGTNPNVLYGMARAGELPAFARLMDEGTTFEHGLIASFPTVTLANHTTALTGVHPGTHGVLHNAYYDRVALRQILTNAPETWHLAREELSGDVETVFEAVARAGAGFTAGVNEPCDRGAGYSTFDLFRTGTDAVSTLASALPPPASVPGATQPYAIDKREYGWASAADHMAVMQATQLWKGEDGHPRPRFLWVNLILNDAANHAGGPHSEIGHAGLRDTDRRLGAILDAMDWGGNDTAFMVLADHGMEQSDPDCKGDYGAALERGGIAFRDEGFGFLYLERK